MGKLVSFGSKVARPRAARRPGPSHGPEYLQFAREPSSQGAVAVICQLGKDVGLPGRLVEIGVGEEHHLTS
jgi:hypothetical protein